jgi:hypothetical protein
VGSARAAQTGSRRTHDGCAASVQRLGLAVGLAAAGSRRLGISRVTCGGRSGFVVARACVGLTSRRAGGACRSAGSCPDLGFASGIRAWLWRGSHLGLSLSRVTAGGVAGPRLGRARAGCSRIFPRRRARGSGRTSFRGPRAFGVGEPIGAASGVGSACRGTRPAAASSRGAERSLVESARRPGMGHGRTRRVGAGGSRRTCAWHLRLGRAGAAAAPAYGRALVGRTCGRPAYLATTRVRLGGATCWGPRAAGGGRLGRAQDRRAGGSRGPLVGCLCTGCRAGQAGGSAARRCSPAARRRGPAAVDSARRAGVERP